MSASLAPCTQVWAHLDGGRQNQSVMYYNNTKYRPDGEGILRQRRYVKMASGSLLKHPRPGWDQWLFFVLD